MPRVCCAPACPRGPHVGTLLGMKGLSNPFLPVLIAWQPVSILLLCLSFPARKTHKPPWGRSSGAGGQKRPVLSPAGHQDCFVGSELLPVHDDDDVRQDIPAPKAVEIEEDIARVAGELDAAVCRRGHLGSARNTSGRRTGMETQPGEHLTPAGRQLLLWDAFGWPGWVSQLLGAGTNSPASCQVPARSPGEVCRPTARPGVPQSHPAQTLLRIS